ncbi:MAG: ATP-binding protein [Legionellales bacterium]|nr:ATP-binding protein [Legionellales bacterium]
MTDIKRNMASKLETLLEFFPIVSIVGARQVGKTTLARQIRPDWHYFDLENPYDYDRISQDPVLFFQQYSDRVIIDEAQRYPVLFQVLRGVIDQQRKKKGRFILTGSSSPLLLQNITESLAGRIAIVELGTLKANEYYQVPLSPFYQLFENKLDKNCLPTGVSLLTNEQMHLIWLKGGYPEPVLSSNAMLYQLWMEQYYNAYISRDIAQLFPRLNQMIYNRFIYMLGKLSGTIINKSELARALEISETSVREYIKIANGTFIWRSLPSFESDSMKTVIKMPKGHLADTGLLHHVLRINSTDDLFRDPQVGRSFESFVVEEIIKGLQATLAVNWQPYYYRTRNGAEIDLVLQGDFGILPIEIKYGVVTPRKRLIALDNFIKERNLPFGIVINQSKECYWLTENIIQIPVGWI